MQPHQWLSGSALKAGRREVPSYIPGCACRPSHSEFFGAFSETRVNMDYDPLERSPRTACFPWAQVPHADYWPYPYNQPTTMEDFPTNHSEVRFYTKKF